MTTNEANTGMSDSDRVTAAQLPANGGDTPDFTHVEVERMDSDTPRGGALFIQSNLPLAKPPYIAAWICLVLAWIFLGSSVPFTVFIGLPLNLAALVLAIVCLSRGAAITGILVLLLGTVGSLIVYLVGLAMFIGNLSGSHGLV